MSRGAFEVILKIKKSELDAKALALAEMKKRMEALSAKRAGIENELQDSASLEFCVATAQVSTRWRHAQSRQLDRIDQALTQMTKELNALEQELRTALGERQAVEKVITNQRVSLAASSTHSILLTMGITPKSRTR